MDSTSGNQDRINELNGLILPPEPAGFSSCQPTGIISAQAVTVALTHHHDVRVTVSVSVTVPLSVSESVRVTECH
eukprot:1220547-Rhodomonas_salina.1